MSSARVLTAVVLAFVLGVLIGLGGGHPDAAGYTLGAFLALAAAAVVFVVACLLAVWVLLLLLRVIRRDWLRFRKTACESGGRLLARTLSRDLVDLELWNGRIAASLRVVTV